MIVEYALKHSSQPLKVWERIEIVVGEGSLAGHYAARIEDFRDDGIAVTSPELESGSTLLSNGCFCLVILTRDDAVYQFGSRIRLLKGKRGNLYVLDPPQNVRRVQRRQFVRIDLLKEAKFAVVESAATDSPEVSDLNWLKATIVDFSGGGALLKISHEIDEGTIVVLSLDFLAEPNLPEAVAAICRRSFIRDKSQMIGLEFLRRETLIRDLNSSQMHQLPTAARIFDLKAQNHLVNYVFKYEVELRNKGLL